jgi:hypothetical protein
MATRSAPMDTREDNTLAVDSRAPSWTEHLGRKVGTAGMGPPYILPDRGDPPRRPSNHGQSANGGGVTVGWKPTKWCSSEVLA